MKRKNEVKIAAGIYIVCCKRYKRPAPIPIIAGALGCSARKATMLVAEARVAGLLPGPATVGFARVNGEVAR